MASTSIILKRHDLHARRQGSGRHTPPFVTERSEGAARNAGNVAQRPTERSEGAARNAGNVAQRPTERSEGAARNAGNVAQRPTERSEGAARNAGIVAQRPTERSEGAARNAGNVAQRPSVAKAYGQRLRPRAAGEAVPATPARFVRLSALSQSRRVGAHEPPA